MINLRPATISDVENLARVHHAAVHGTATSTFYTQDILDSWAPSSTDEYAMCWFRQSIENIEHSIVVAELGNNAVIVGFGCVIPSKQEVRAIYVDSVFARQGIGSKILAYLEELALRHGTDKLYLDASLNAENFYFRHGYSVIERATRRLNSSISMGCVKMSKDLRTH